MSQWTPAQWAEFLASVGAFIGTVVTSVISILNGRKATLTQSKVDENTQLTKDIHNATTPKGQQ